MVYTYNKKQRKKQINEETDCSASGSAEAVGGNETAAGYTGINTKRIKMIVFMMSGAFAAFAGIMYAGHMQSGRYTFADGDEMSVITARCRHSWLQLIYHWHACWRLADGYDQQCAGSGRPVLCRTDHRQRCYYHSGRCTEQHRQQEEKLIVHIG